jgi:hypothetical protein
VELDKGAAQIGVDLGAGGIRAEIELGLCDSGGSKFKVPECPDAEGTLKGSDESVVFFAIRIFKGAELLLEQSVDVRAETKIEPIQVDDDAKLEYFEIDHEYVTDAQLGGSTQAFGPIGLRVKYHGHTRVTFPGGSYDPSATDVEVKLNVAGAQADEAHELRDLEFDQELKAKKEADKNFAAEVDKAIGRITERESGWRQPNKCAEIKFEPATEALVLKRNQGGSLKARLDSRQGGSPQSAKWSLLGAQNAQINPGSALANPASFSYTVTNAGSGVLVRGTFKAVSRAGVAEGSWTQKTEEEAINHIAGTFGGEWTYETTAGPTKQEWTGTVVFDRFSPAVLGGASGSYNLTSGTVTVTASGIEQTSATACEQEGTKTFTYQGGGAAGSIYVGGSGQQQTAPYTYSLQTSGPPELMTIKRFNCPESAKKEGYEGSTGQIAPLYKFEVPEGHSPDGIEYAGSVEEDYGSTVVKQHWNLTGTP